MQGYETTGTFINCWWEWKIVWPLWRAFCQVVFSWKLKIYLPYDSAIPLMVIYIHIHKYVLTKNYIHMFIITLFETVRHLKHLRCFQWYKATEKGNRIKNKQMGLHRIVEFLQCKETPANTKRLTEGKQYLQWTHYIKNSCSEYIMYSQISTTKSPRLHKNMESKWTGTSLTKTKQKAHKNNLLLMKSEPGWQCNTISHQ